MRPLDPGELFGGRYQIKGTLGSGEFATVYEATQRVCGLDLRTVALKVFSDQIITEQNVRRVFRDAIAILSLMEEEPDPAVGRHFIPILDGGISNDDRKQAFLAMEYVDGKTLRRVIQRQSGVPGINGLPVELGLLYLQQILTALAWMHSRDLPMVHGDLHSGNVLVSSNGLVRLADFGFAMRLPAGSSGGAIRCQAPETLLGQPGDTRSEVFSVGLLWYEMLTGREPYQSDRLEELALNWHCVSAELEGLPEHCDDRQRCRLQRAHGEAQQEFVHAQVQARKRPPRPPSEMNEELVDHSALEEMVLRCLAYEPAARFASAGQLKHAIDDYFVETKHAPNAVVFGLQAPVTVTNKVPAPRGVNDHAAEVPARLEERDTFGEIRLQMNEMQEETMVGVSGLRAQAQEHLNAARHAPPEPREVLVRKALDCLAEAQAIAEEDPQVWELLAQAYQLGNQFEVSQRCLRKAHSLRTSQ